MINYFVDLFNKPLYMWTLGNKLALFGLCLLLLTILFLICGIVWCIVDSVKAKKFKTCCKDISGHHCWHHQDCLRCSFYKKSQKELKKDE